MTALRRCFSTAFQVKHKNLQDQKLFYSLHVILVEDSEVIKISLTLLGLLGEDVAVVSVLPLDFSRSGKREALFGTGVGLKLCHCFNKLNVNIVLRTQRITFSLQGRSSSSSSFRAAIFLQLHGEAQKLLLSLLGEHDGTSAEEYCRLDL